MTNRWMIEYFAEGEATAADCDPDFYPSREAAERQAPVAMPEWANRWRVYETDLENDEETRAENK